MQAVWQVFIFVCRQRAWLVLDCVALSTVPEAVLISRLSKSYVDARSLRMVRLAKVFNLR